MRIHNLIKVGVLAGALALTACGTEPQGSESKAGNNPELSLTGDLRIYQAGASQGLQLDVRNISQVPVFGPQVSMNIEGVAFFGNCQLYPYWGGNVSTANTVFPLDFGYVKTTLPPNTQLVPGQRLKVTISAFGQSSSFPTKTQEVVVCRQGASGCG